MKYSVFATVLLVASTASAMHIPRQQPSNGAPDAVGAPNGAPTDPNANLGADPNAALPEGEENNGETTITPGVPAPAPAPGTPAPGTPEPEVPEPEVPEPEVPEPEVPEPEVPEPEVPEPEVTETEVPEPDTGLTEEPEVLPGGPESLIPGGDVKTVSIDVNDYLRVYKFVKKLVRTGDYASLVALQLLTDEALDLFGDEPSSHSAGGPGSWGNDGASYHTPGGHYQSKRGFPTSGQGFRAVNAALGRIG